MVQDFGITRLQTRVRPQYAVNGITVAQHLGKQCRLLLGAASGQGFQEYRYVFHNLIFIKRPYVPFIAS